MMLLDSDELCVERSHHGGSEPLDSFSESCGGSRDPSRRGATNRSAHGPSAHALASRLQQSFSWRRSSVSDKNYSKSLSSGTAYYQHLHRQYSSELSPSPANQSKAQPGVRGNDNDSAVTFSFPNVEDSACFAPRWAHSAVALGDRMYVYGGLAAMGCPLSGLYVFSFGECRSVASWSLASCSMPWYNSAQV